MFLSSDFLFFVTFIVISTIIISIIIGSAVERQRAKNGGKEADTDAESSDDSVGYNNSPSDEAEIYVDKYNYRRKRSVATRAELVFYKRLARLLQKRCYIFPQAHLSCFLDHEVRWQSWKGALSHINGKSVDYLLCEKETLEPICAIELDDRTHDTEERRERDKVVEAILRQAGVPLARFRNPANMTDKEILDQLGAVINELKRTT